MLKKEFEERTGFFPSEKMYRAIEETYTKMEHVNKDEFCRMYKENEDGLATLIQRNADYSDFHNVSEGNDEISRLKKELEKVKAEKKQLADAYERELEWRPYFLEDMYSDYEYKKLQEAADNGLMDRMTDDDAKNFIRKTFGFEFEAIKIIREYPMRQINRHGLICNIPEKTFSREPLYCATDYNYILFSVLDYEYECVDGELYMLIK